LLDHSSGDFSTEGNIEFLKSGRANSRVEPCGMGDIKRGLAAQGVDCRSAGAFGLHA